MTMIFSSLCLSGINVLVFRDDLNHPTISGNKLHKLTPHIALAKARGCNSIASFGGPYSNHLHALAWACKNAKLSSIGIIRGELHEALTPTLKDCQRWGMTLIPSTRKDYRNYQELLSKYTQAKRMSELPYYSFFSTIDNDPLIIPEGGSNELAIKLLSSAYGKIWTKKESRNVSHVVCATGTGATVAGLCTSTPNHIRVIAMQAVAEGDATLKRIQSWLKKNDTSLLSMEQSHLGGFGKIPPHLKDFLEDFETQHGIPLDPIYNGKAMLMLSEMIHAGYFKSTDKILFIHTGGIQGKRGIPNIKPNSLPITQ